MSSAPCNVSSSPASGLNHSILFILPVLVLALGHMISNLLRTLPAVSADVMAFDLGLTEEGLASLTAAYHFAFAAGQIPVGVALDRYGVKPVSLTLLAAVAVGAAFAALVQGPTGFLAAQLALGLGCCGMLLCPMTLAAKSLTPAKFGLWSGLIQGVGNAGMLLSASPLAWLVHMAGWRAGFWVSGLLAVIVLILVRFIVPHSPEPDLGMRPSIASEAREVVRIGMSRGLRGVVILAFVSFAVVISLRGLWGGPWLMEIKGMSRIEAGHTFLPFTLALILGPVLYGLADRRFGRRRLILTIGHMVAGVALLLLWAGGPGGWLSRLAGQAVLPGAYDVGVLLVFGLSIAVQPLLFALGRATVAPQNTGKALSAVNLAFFAGAAVIQSATGPVAGLYHMPGVMLFLGTCVLSGTLLFLWFTRPGPQPSANAVQAYRDAMPQTKG